MKKLMTFAALLAVGVWFAGCGESATTTKTPSPPVTSGAPAGHKAPEGHKADEGDKGAEPEAGKATEGTEATPGEDKPTEGEAAGSEEKAPE